jgi:hypothetical protein
MDDNREYYETMEEFLRSIHQKQVVGVCLIAQMDKQEDEDFVIHYNIDRFALAQAAGLMLMRAARGTEELEDEDE